MWHGAVTRQQSAIRRVFAWKNGNEIHTAVTRRRDCEYHCFMRPAGWPAESYIYDTVHSGACPISWRTPHAKCTLASGPEQAIYNFREFHNTTTSPAFRSIQF